MVIYKGKGKVKVKYSSKVLRSILKVALLVGAVFLVINLYQTVRITKDVIVNPEHGEEVLVNDLGWYLVVEPNTEDGAARFYGMTFTVVLALIGAVILLAAIVVEGIIGILTIICVLSGVETDWNEDTDRQVMGVRYDGYRIRYAPRLFVFGDY